MFMRDKLEKLVKAQTYEIASATPTVLFSLLHLPERSVKMRKHVTRHATTSWSLPYFPPTFVVDPFFGNEEKIGTK